MLFVARKMFNGKDSQAKNAIQTTLCNGKASQA